MSCVGLVMIFGQFPHAVHNPLENSRNEGQRFGLQDWAHGLREAIRQADDNRLPRGRRRL